jgi:adenylylsulfate kinase
MYTKEEIQKKVISIETEYKGSITCIYGESGSGKTYKALFMKAFKEVDVILDGDSVRTYLNDDLGYSDEDRRRNNIRIAKIALMLANQGLRVAISTVRADIAYEWLKGKVDRLYKIHLDINHEEIIEDKR